MTYDPVTVPKVSRWRLKGDIRGIPSEKHHIRGGSTRKSFDTNTLQARMALFECVRFVYIREPYALNACTTCTNGEQTAHANPRYMH